jgi:hypothetical protein
MRNLLAFLAALVIVVVSLGWYLEWFAVRRAATPKTGQSSYTIDINSEKIREDVHDAAREGSEKLRDLLDRDPPAEAERPAGAKKTPGPTSADRFHDGPRLLIEEGEEAEPRRFRPR